MHKLGGHTMSDICKERCYENIRPTRFANPHTFVWSQCHRLIYIHRWCQFLAVCGLHSSGVNHSDFHRNSNWCWCHVCDRCLALCLGLAWSSCFVKLFTRRYKLIPKTAAPQISYQKGSFRINHQDTIS